MPKKASSSKQVLPTDTVLSVQQPDAQFLVTARKGNPLLAEKWIENRSWEPSLPVGSWILIHASGTRLSPQQCKIFRIPVDHVTGAIIGYVRLIGWKRLKFTDHSKQPFISGEPCGSPERHEEWLKWRYAEIADDDAVWKQHCKGLKDIVKEHTGIRPKHGSDHIGRKNRTVHWIFAEPTLLDEPIPCSGKLRLWTYDGDVGPS